MHSTIRRRPLGNILQELEIDMYIPSFLRRSRALWIPLPKLFNLLSEIEDGRRDFQKAWDGKLVFYRDSKERPFTPFGEIPPVMDNSIGKLGVIWIAQKSSEYLKSYMEHKALSTEAEPYPYKQMVEIDHPFETPGICINDKVYNLTPAACGDIALGKVLYTYNKRKPVGNLSDVLKQYEDATSRCRQERADFLEEVQAEFTEFCKKTTIDRKKKGLPTKTEAGEVILFDESRWRVLYNPSKFSCTFELEQRQPYIMESEASRFYEISAPFAVGFRICGLMVHQIIWLSSTKGYPGFTPVITYPGSFQHPFVSGNVVCTNGFAEGYRCENLFTGMIDVLQRTLEILKMGYSDRRSNYTSSTKKQMRFTPHKKLGDINGLRSFSSIDAAKKTGLPIYRFYLDDRNGRAMQGSGIVSESHSELVPF